MTVSDAALGWVLGIGVAAATVLGTVLALAADRYLRQGCKWLTREFSGLSGEENA
jgi:uncharacterized membrane protein YhiD involved in acid resistance